MSTQNVYVRSLETKEIVQTIPWRYSPDSSMHERALMGLLRNMNTDAFFIDTSEVDG